MSEFQSSDLPAQFERPVPVWIDQPPGPTRAQYLIAFTLLLGTFFTTLVVGTRLSYNYSHRLAPFVATESSIPRFPVGYIVEDPRRLLQGLPFALAVMGILFAHEMGHFVMCLRYRVDATPPYFIPAPTLIGTMGAFIKIRSAFPSRKSLFDIGIAGPIAGFVVAVPVTVIGLLRSYPVATVPEAEIQLGYPLLFRALHGFFIQMHLQPHQSISHLVLHPLAIAGWTGMFATSLNLLPGGQLDGGHIVYAWSERAHKLVSRIAIIALIPLAYYKWVGWLMWGAVLYVTGLRHPMVYEDDRLDAKRKWLVGLALLILVVSIVPAAVVDSGIVNLKGDFLDSIHEIRDLIVHLFRK
jgi:membrane-associated protease RseP (regulator of RpoE activity)